MSPEDAWPDTRPLIVEALSGYLADASITARWNQPTRCPPWTVRDITRHLAATFTRFDALLRQSRRGDLTAPFDVDGLSTENLRAVAEFRGEPETALAEAVERFVAATDRPDEPMAHQFGPISVGLQLAFGLNELVLHHHDVCDAVGHRWHASREVTAILVEVWHRALGGLPDAADDWLRLLAASGRGLDPVSRR